MRAILKVLPSATEHPTVRELLDSTRKIRVLYIRHDLKIGDLVMMTGIMRAIANSSSNIVLDVLTSSTAAPALIGNPHVHAIHIHDRKKWKDHPGLWLRLRRQRYAIVVDGRINHVSWHGTLPGLLLATGCRLRIGAECEHRRLYTHTVKVKPGLHFVEQGASVLEPFGVKTDEIDLQPEIILADRELAAADSHWQSVHERSAGRVRLLVNISAAATQRLWPNDRFIEVLEHVRSHPTTADIIVISSPRDRHAAAEIARAVGATAVATPDLRDAIALVATCDLLLTPDTGIAHVASAFSKRTVDLLLARPVAPGPLMRKDAFVPYCTPGHNVYSPDMQISSLKTGAVIQAMDEQLNELAKRISGASRRAILK